MTFSQQVVVVEGVPPKYPHELTQREAYLVATEGLKAATEAISGLVLRGARDLVVDDDQDELDALLQHAAACCGTLRDYEAASV